MENKKDIVVFGLSTSKDMAEKVSEKLNIELGKVKFKSFADGELFTESETSVRGKSAFVIQSTQRPANDNLMELLLFIDALKRSSAKEVNVVIPYFGYARQDRKVFGRQSISAKLVANLITTAGADRIITFDIHSEQIAGFFDIPFDNIRSTGIIADEFKKMNIEDLTIVSPDHGGVVRAREFAKLFNDAPMAVIDKRREEHNKAEAMFILGEVKDRNIIIYDDMVDTGGTVVSAVNKLKEKGARDIYLAITHPILSGTTEDRYAAINRIYKSGLKGIITTNSINIFADESKEDFVKQIDLSNIIAEVIEAHIEHRSITDHFINNYNTKL